MYAPGRLMKEDVMVREVLTQSVSLLGRLPCFHSMSHHFIVRHQQRWTSISVHSHILFSVLCFATRQSCKYPLPVIAYLLGSLGLMSSYRSLPHISIDFGCIQPQRSQRRNPPPPNGAPLVAAAGDDAGEVDPTRNLVCDCEDGPNLAPCKVVWTGYGEVVVRRTDVSVDHSLVVNHLGEVLLVYRPGNVSFYNASQN